MILFWLFSAFGKATSTERGRTSTVAATHFGPSGSSHSHSLACNVVRQSITVSNTLTFQEEIEELERENRLHHQQVGIAVLSHKLYSVCTLIEIFTWVYEAISIYWQLFFMLHGAAHMTLEKIPSLLGRYWSTSSFVVWGFIGLTWGIYTALEDSP